MRNSKRWLAAILAGAMIAVTGCSGSASKQETTAAQTTAAETTAEETTAAKTTAEAKEGETTTFVDDLGREVELELPITRACVANRYNNELIRAVGAGDAVVGVDQYTAQDPVYLSLIHIWKVRRLQRRSFCRWKDHRLAERLFLQDQQQHVSVPGYLQRYLPVSYTHLDVYKRQLRSLGIATSISP